MAKHVHAEHSLKGAVVDQLERGDIVEDERVSTLANEADANR